MESVAADPSVRNQSSLAMLLLPKIVLDAVVAPVEVLSFLLGARRNQGCGDPLLLQAKQRDRNRNEFAAAKHFEEASLSEMFPAKQVSARAEGLQLDQHVNKKKSNSGGSSQTSLLPAETVARVLVRKDMRDAPFKCLRCLRRSLPLRRRVLLTMALIPPYLSPSR